MPLRKEFFENFFIRATPVFNLNDPYEGLFNKNQLLDLKKTIKNIMDNMRILKIGNLKSIWSIFKMRFFNQV